MDDKSLHPIQVAAARSGLSAHRIRIWERRYGAVRPQRDAHGRRLYTPADLDRLRRLRAAVGSGRRISDVAHLPEEELAALVQEDAAGTAAGSAPDIAAFLEPVLQLDADLLERRLTHALAAQGLDRFVDATVGPLMREVGEGWHAGRLGVHHEHLASAVVRDVLGRGLDRIPAGASRGTLVMASLSGQRHEIGLLVAAAAAAQEGWRVVYLGLEVPAEDIAAACRQTGAERVGLTMTWMPPGSDPWEEFRRLRSRLPTPVRLLIGGAEARRNPGFVIASGARGVADLPGLRSELSAPALA